MAKETKSDYKKNLLRLYCENCNEGIEDLCDKCLAHFDVGDIIYCSDGSDIAKDAHICEDCYNKVEDD